VTYATNYGNILYVNFLLKKGQALM